MKAAYINSEKKKFEIKEIKNKEVIGPGDFGIDCHLNEYKSYKYEPLNPKNVLCFGIGALCGSLLPGTARLVFVTRSPLWKGLFLSVVSGAGLPFYATGLDFGLIEGKAKKPTVIIIKNFNKKLTIKFKEIKKEGLWEIYSSYKGEKGLYALQQYLFDSFKNEFGNVDFRILVVGPASFNTNMGAICSTWISNGEFQIGSDGWVGRAGFGSVMAQAHGVVAILFGGDYNGKEFKENLRDMDVRDKIFKENFGKPYAQVVLESTKKYRYDEAIKSGGTFGSNMTELGTWIPMFNWNSIYLPYEERKKLYENLIKNNYLKQFNEEVIKTKSWKTCGEPCPVMCKKIRDYRKIDYEPYESCGPNSGIFDQNMAEAVMEEIERMGFDAIEFGNILSFVLECLQKGYLRKEDIGIEDGINFNPLKFNLNNSLEHSYIGRKLAKIVAYKENEIGEILSKGIRIACKELSKKYKKNFVDIANYVPFGKEGCIAPCQYWVPGFLIPLPIQGKFFTYYGLDCRPPRELAKISADRAVKEFYSENTGICRFHRKWTEPIIEILLKKGLGIEINYYEHCKDLIKKIIKYNELAGLKPIYWESKKTKDIIYTYLKEVKRVFGESKDVLEWINKYEKDFESASKEYWQELLKGIKEVIEK